MWGAGDAGIPPASHPDPRKGRDFPNGTVWERDPGLHSPTTSPLEAGGRGQHPFRGRSPELPKHRGKSTQLRGAVSAGPLGPNSQATFPVSGVPKSTPFTPKFWI